MKKILKVCLLALTAISLFSCGNGGSDGWTVEFMLNNGTTEVYKSIEVVDGEKVEAPTDPTRNGYTFAGWYVDESCTVYFDEGSEVITADTKLYASWVSSGLANPDTKPDSSENENNSSEVISSEVESDLPGSTEAPTSGYALLFNDTNYVPLEKLDGKDFQDREQFAVMGLSISEGQTFKCYDGSSSVSWVEKVLEPYGANAPESDPCFEVTDDGIKCLISGTYDIYVKMKWKDNTIYIGVAA